MINGNKGSAKRNPLSDQPKYRMHPHSTNAGLSAIGGPLAFHWGDNLLFYFSYINVYLCQEGPVRAPGL